MALVAFVGLTPAAATGLRSRSSSSALVAENLGRSAQDQPASISKPTAVMAVRGKLKQPTVLSSPTELRLRKAHGAVFDARALKSTVVKHERPELAAPGQAAEETNPTASMPATIDPKAMTSTNAPAPAPDANFEGLDFGNWGAGHPPDTNGDVGPNYYIQTINSSIGIYDKSNGNRVAAFTFNTFMSQGNFGNVCDTNNFGDPVVLYDSFEDRWFITDFAFQLVSGNISPPHVFQCFAVSKTGDPVAGGWNFYSIEAPGGIDDYPKFGVWPDGIYMSANMFGYTAGASFIAPHVWAINKAQMYAGEPSVQVADFPAPPSDFTLTPANARLQAGTPPTGRPEYFVSTWQFLNALTVYKLHVDWDKISTSTFSGPDIPINATGWPNQAVGNAATPGNPLDTLQIRSMAQTQYSNLGGAESLWVSHTVRRILNGTAAPRWYQLNVTGGTVAASTVQGTTWDPDGANTFYRFMPSLAVDRMGDMALGYSKSNSATDPQIKYAGRLAGDPVNTFSQDEQTLIDGSGTQVGNCGTSTCIRWGDYSGMALDPNGCTFWETNEYYIVDGLDHHTRIGSFRFPGCSTVGNGTLTGTVTKTGSGDPISGATVALGNRTATTDGSGNYSFTVPAGSYPSLTASMPGFDPASASGISVADGGTTTHDFSLDASATSGCFNDNTQNAFQRGIPNGCDLTSSPGSVQLSQNIVIDQQNTTVTNSGFGFNSTNWAGQTFTPAITAPVTRIDLDLFCSGCAGTTPDITVSIRATSGSPAVPTGADLATATIAGFSSGAGGYFSANFGSPATLTAGTTYAVVFRPVANPSAGLYAYVVSSANPYANGQRVVSGNSGAAWAADVTRDLGFKVWVNTGFVPSGTLVSSLKDANPGAGHTPQWTTLSFTSTEPAGTDVQFRVGASNNSYGPFAFVGPDGTAGTFFTTSGADLSQFNGFRYLRYKAYLLTGSSSVSPTLGSVTVCFDDRDVTNLAVDPASGTYGGTTDLSATLTSGANGVSGKTIDFALNGTGVGSATTNASGVATLNDASLAGIDAGSYPAGVAASFAGDTAYQPSDGASSLTVEQAPLTITANDRSKLYGKSLTLGTTAFTPTGLVGGDSVASVTLTSAGTPAAAAVGTYPIVPSAAVAASGTDLDNYLIHYANGTLTVYLAGIVGLDSVSVGGKNAFIDSFDSAIGPYSAANSDSAASVFSNGAIALGGAKVFGDVRSSQGSVALKLGSLVTGDVTAGTTITNGGTINGTATPNSPAAPLAPAAVATCSPYSTGSDLGGKFTYSAASGDLAVKGGNVATLAAGSYCFHNVTLSGGSTVRATGPVVIRLNGQLDAGGGSRLVNATSVPANLEIRSSFAGGDGVSLASFSAYVTVYAPSTDITLSGGSVLFGDLLGKTLNIAGDSAVHFDIRSTF